MPKVERFEIELDNSLAVYHAGTTLKGKVVIVLNEPMEMRGVRLTINGKAHTHWTEYRSTGTTTISVPYRGNVNYFNQERTLWGNHRGVDGPKQILPAGTHTFDFTYALPATCSSSFEGEHGYIRYLVECRIDRPWKFDVKTKRPFTLLGKLDLNSDPKAGKSLTKIGRKSLGFAFFKAGDITCKVSIPKQGYVPGEMVQVSAIITNNSSRCVNKVSMRLIQRVKFTAHHWGSCHKKTRDVVLAEITKAENVQPGKTRMWTNEGTRLSPVPPTLADCNIIDIGYLIEFKVTPSGPSFSSVMTLPFTVGSVPLSGQKQQSQEKPRQAKRADGANPRAGAGVSPKNPAAGVQPTAPPTANVYPMLPPPTYAEVTSGKVNIKDETDNDYTKGQLEYAPRYAYYDLAPAVDEKPALKEI